MMDSINTLTTTIQTKINNSSLKKIRISNTIINNISTINKINSNLFRSTNLNCIRESLIKLKAALNCNLRLGRKSCR